jgi:hypothetical protein
MNERDIAQGIASGALSSPQHFGNSFWWAIRISGCGCAWRASMNEFCWREPSLWLSADMCARATGLPVLVDHPESGTLNSPEFAARCVGVTVLVYVRDDELWAIARVLDSGANEILLAGAYEDTSPAVTFAPGTGARIDIGGQSLLVEPEPLLLDHIALCARGVWSRDSAPEGVETTMNEPTNHEDLVNV